MDKTPIAMIREDLNNIPDQPLPPGYSFRLFRGGEEEAWARVNADAGNFETVEKALERWELEFAAHVEEMEKRCILLVHDGSGQVIGTSTAWYDPNFRDGDYGRLHWVAIQPDFQGRGLAKPMLTETLRLIAQWHDKAYLRTLTSCQKAIRMYLDYGFVPLLVDSGCEAAWREVAKVIEHPALGAYRGQ